MNRGDFFLSLANKNMCWGVKIVITVSLHEKIRKELNTTKCIKYTMYPSSYKYIIPWCICKYLENGRKKHAIGS